MAIKLKTLILPAVLGAALLLQGCTPDVRERMQNQSSARRHIDAGMAHLVKGRRGTALASFKRAIAVDPENAETYQYVIEILFSEKAYKEAIPLIEKAINIPPKGVSSSHKQAEKLHDSNLYTMLGDAYWQLGDIDGAVESYGKAIELNTENATAYNNWGYMLADEGIRLDEALRLTRKAVDLQPDNSYSIDSLGWVYYRRGDISSATRLLEKAVRLDPRNAEIRYHLGMAYEKCGKHKHARIEYRKALVISPTFAPARKQLHNSNTK